MCELAIFPQGPSWVLLDEGAAELGRFASEGAAYAAAGEYVRRINEPRYIMIGEDGGDWREDLLYPPASH